MCRSLWVISILSVCGCALTPRPPIASDARVDALSRKLKTSRSQLTDLREENQILRIKLGLSGAAASKTKKPSKTTKAKSGMSKRPSPLRQTVKAAKVSGKKPRNEAEGYVQVIEAYRRGQRQQLLSRQRAFVQAYPKSVFADNALYLAALNDFYKGRLSESLSLFDEIVKNYPKGDKRVSAMLAKGLVYKKLNVQKSAKTIFKRVIATYPGSREAAQAQIELKLLKMNSN